MKFNIYKHLIIFATVFIITSLFDYSKYNKWIWTENIIQAFFFTLFFGLIMWLLNSFQKK
jgi:hypothetical protein